MCFLNPFSMFYFLLISALLLPHTKHFSLISLVSLALMRLTLLFWSIIIPRNSPRYISISRMVPVVATTPLMCS